MKSSLIIALSILTLIAGYAGYSHFLHQEVVDLDCGLTSHFQNWINANGSIQIIQGIPHTISIDPTSTVLPLEVRALMMRLSAKFL